LGLVISAIAACVALAFLSDAAAQRSQPADQIRGKQLYYDHGCYGCHGFNGETGRPRLAGKGIPILETPETFIAFLRSRADAMPLLPSTSMPSYPVTALTDSEARDIYAYVRTFVLNAPDPRRIVPLQTIIDSVKPIQKATP
jgi:mono/diheme cytochrome c family protein